MTPLISRGASISLELASHHSLSSILSPSVCILQPSLKLTKIEEINHCSDGIGQSAIPRTFNHSRALNIKNNNPRSQFINKPLYSILARALSSDNAAEIRRSEEPPNIYEEDIDREEIKQTENKAELLFRSNITHEIENINNKNNIMTPQFGTFSTLNTSASSPAAPGNYGSAFKAVRQLQLG